MTNPLPLPSIYPDDLQQALTTYLAPLRDLAFRTSHPLHVFEIETAIFLSYLAERFASAPEEMQKVFIWCRRLTGERLTEEKDLPVNLDEVFKFAFFSCLPEVCDAFENASTGKWPTRIWRFLPIIGPEKQCRYTNNYPSNYPNINPAITRWHFPRCFDGCPITPTDTLTDTLSITVSRFSTPQKKRTTPSKGGVALLIAIFPPPKFHLNSPKSSSSHL